MQVQLQDNDMIYQDQYEVQQRILQIDILKDIFTSTNQKFVQIIMTFKQDSEKFQSFKQLHRKLKPNIVSEFNNVFVQKIVNLLKTFMLQKQFFQTKIQKATLWFISKIIVQEKIVQVSSEMQITIYEMFNSLTTVDDFIDLSKYMRYFTSRNKQISDSFSKQLFYLYYERAQQKAQNQPKFKQTYQNLDLQNKTIVQLQIILYLNSQHSKYKIEEAQFAKKIQVLKQKPFKKLLQFVIKKKKTKNSRQLRVAVLKTKFELNTQDQVQYKFIPSIHLCEELRTYETLQLVALNSFSSQILNEIANDSTIHKANNIYVKWPISIINCLQDKLTDDQNQIPLLQNFHQLLKFIKIIFQNRDKKLITKQTQKKIIQEKSQNKGSLMIEYLCKLFDTFSKYISRNSLELTQRTLTLNQHLPSSFIQHLLKYFLQLINKQQIQAQKWFQTSLQSVFTFMAHIFYRRQYQNITGYDSDISKALRQIMVKVESFSLKWRRLRNTKVVIDRWAQTVPKTSEDYKIIIRKFLTSYFNKNVVISSKSSSTVFNPLFITRAYSNLFCGQLLQFIIEFSKDLQKFNDKQMYNSQSQQEADATMSKIILFLSSRLKMPDTNKVCQILIKVYKKYAHIVPSIYTFRAWLLMGKQATTKHQVNVDELLQQIITIHQFIPQQIIKIPVLQIISKVPLKEEYMHNLNMYKKICKTAVSQLQFKLKNDIFGYERFVTIFKIIETQMQLMQKLQQKIIQTMKIQAQKIGNILVQNSLTSSESVFQIIQTICNDFKMVIRYYICNAQKVLNVQDQADLIKVITHWLSKQALNQNIRAIIQANQILAYSLPAHNSHLSKKQVLGAWRNLNGNDQLSLNQPEFSPLNMVISFHQNIHENYKQLLKFLLNHKKYAQQPTFIENETSSLIKWMKNIQKYSQLNQNIESANCRLMIQHIIFPMTNYSGPCIFNGKTQQSGKQQMALGVYISQIQMVFQLQINQILTLNFRNNLKTILNVLKNKISKIVQVKNNRIEGRYRSNRQRRTFTEASQELTRLNIPQQLIEVALENVQIPDAQLALQWIQNNQGRLDQILYQRILKKSKQENKMVKQPSPKQKQKGFFIQMLSYSSFKQKIQKDMKNLIKKLAQELFSQNGLQIRILLFILLDSFQKDQFKTKNYKTFSEKMFKQIEKINQQKQIDSRKLNLIIAVLNQNISLCPSIMVEVYSKGINLKLLGFIPKLSNVDASKNFQLLANILPSFKQNQKIQDSVISYLSYMIDIISKSTSDSSHISTILYKIIQSGNQELKRKVIKIFKSQLVKGVFKKKPVINQNSGGIFNVAAQPKQISIFSSIHLLFESDSAFSMANMELQLKGFIIENYKNQIIKLKQNKNQQKNKKVHIQIDLKKFSISFQRFDKNKKFNQVCQKILSKKKNKKQFFFFNVQKHNLFQSQILGESFLSLKHKSEQKLIIDCLIDLLVCAQKQEQQQIYLVQLHKLMQYYKILIPLVFRKNIEGNNICQWIIQKCLISNRKKYDFLQFLCLNNNLFISVQQQFSNHTCSFLLNCLTKVLLNKQFKNQTYLILMYMLQINKFSKFCLLKISKDNNVSLKQILQDLLKKCALQVNPNHIQYILLSQCLSILQKRKLIDNLKSKYLIVTQSNETITQKQFLQMNLLYRIDLSQEQDTTSRKKKQQGGVAYLRNAIGINSQSRLIVDQVDDDQNQMEEQADQGYMNLRQLLRMRFAPRDQNSGRNQQPIFIPIQASNQPERIGENINSVSQHINQVNQVNEAIEVNPLLIEEPNVISQQQNLSQGRVNQQREIAEDLKMEIQKMQMQKIEQPKRQQTNLTIQQLTAAFASLIKINKQYQIVQQQNELLQCILPKQATKITALSNCSLNVVDQKQKLENASFKKIIIFQKRFISIVSTIDPKLKPKFQIKKQTDSSIGRRLADRLIMSGDVANRQQMVNHIQRLINQRAQEEQVQRIRPMNLNQIIIGLEEQVDPPVVIQRPYQQQIPISSQSSGHLIVQSQNMKKQEVSQGKQIKDQIKMQQKIQQERPQQKIEEIKQQVPQKNISEVKDKQIQKNVAQRMEIQQSQNNSNQQIKNQNVIQSQIKSQQNSQKQNKIELQKQQEVKPVEKINMIVQEQIPENQNIVTVVIPNQMTQNEHFRQILSMFNLPQTFLADNGIDSQLFDQLPEEYQIDQITHYMGLAQQNSANRVNNQNNNNQNNQQNIEEQVNNVVNENANNSNQQRNPQDDIINQNIALFASMDPQTRAQMLADYPPQFLLTLPVQMRTQVQQFRQRQIGRMLQQQQRQEMAQQQNQRINPGQLNQPRRNLKKLKYPKLLKSDFAQIQQKTAQSLTKCLFLKLGKLRTHEGFRVLLQNKLTEDKALASLILLLKQQNHFQVNEGQYDSQKQSWKFQRVLIQGFQMKKFKGKLLALIYECIKYKSYKDDDFLKQKIGYQNYLGQSQNDFNISESLQADEEGMHPLYQLMQVSIDIHPQLSVELIKKCKALPNPLIQKLVQFIKCDKLASQFYNHLDFLSENAYMKQLFAKQFTEQKPPKIQNFARLLKYKFSKVPYLKKMHQQALGNFTPTYYQFLNQIFSIYTMEDIKQIQQILIKYKHVHYQIIKQLYSENRSLDKQPMGVILKMPHLLDFQTKKYLFRKHPKIKKTARYRLPIEVDRTNIFQESYNQIMSKTPRQLQGRLQISFRDEQGYDAGGLTRQWLMCLSRQIFNPDYALFQPSSSGNTYQPNPKSYINPDHLLYFKFVGRFVGKALADNELVDAYFTRAFYKMILGQQVEFSDLQQQDYPFYKSMQWLKQNPIQQGDYTFSYLYDNFGNRIVKDLIPNGRNIPVNEANKNQYIQKYCLSKMRDDFKVQVQKFLEGFHQIISHQCISFFQAKQLQLLISGLPQIDFEDLKKNVDYSNYSPTDPIITWFWQILEEYSQQDLARLIQFITGTSKIPVDGFENLKGMNGPQRISIHKDPVTYQLPKAHTCFNQLDLPNYPNKQLLKEKLRTAITWGSQGFGFM